MQPSDGGQVEDREAILHYVRRQLIGPVDGEHELLPRATAPALPHGDTVPDRRRRRREPARRHPRRRARVMCPASLGEDQSEDPVSLAGQRLPSAVGVSFILPAWEADPG